MTLISLQPIVPDYGTQYEGNPTSHHGAMLEDGLTYRQMDGWLDMPMEGTLSYMP